MQLNVHLEIEELISSDMKAILMLGCMVCATFFFIIFQLRAHAAAAAVWLLRFRDGRKSTARAVAYPCCMCAEPWIWLNGKLVALRVSNRSW